MFDFKNIDSSLLKNIFNTKTTQHIIENLEKNSTIIQETTTTDAIRKVIESPYEGKHNVAVPA
jgi:hypothetical protein